MKKIFILPDQLHSHGGIEKLVSENTYSIHHFAMSWIPKKDRFLSDFKRKLMQILGYDTVNYLINVLQLKEIKKRLFKK